MSEPALQQEPLHLESRIRGFIEGGPTEPDGLDEDGEPTEKKIDPEPRWAIVHVGVYELQQCYGGPEEGGWWYDAGDPVEYWPVRVRWTGDGTYDLTDDEQKFVERIEGEIREEYVFGTTHRTSCGPSRGDDYTWRLTWQEPTSFPETRPHYC